MKTLIDSQLSIQQALADNPQNPTPPDIRQNLELLQVAYLGFDGKEHTGQIVMAKDVIAEVEAFFKRALELRFPHRESDTGG